MDINITFITEMGTMHKYTIYSKHESIYLHGISKIYKSWLKQRSISGSKPFRYHRYPVPDHVVVEQYRHRDYYCCSSNVVLLRHYCYK